VPTDGLCFGTERVFTAGMSICWKHSSAHKNLLLGPADETSTEGGMKANRNILEGTYETGWRQK